MVEWRWDCRHLTVVGLHDTGSWCPLTDAADVLNDLLTVDGGKTHAEAAVHWTVVKGEVSVRCVSHLVPSVVLDLHLVHGVSVVVMIIMR